MREALERKQVIGIVGGMGSYATLNFFSRLLMGQAKDNY